jgi:anti-anti-sigma factor
MDARRSWATPARSQPAERPRYSPLETVRAGWHTFTAQLRRAHFATPVLDRAPEQRVASDSPVHAAKRELTITRRRYDHGLHFLVVGQLDTETAHQLRQECDRVDPDAVDTVVLDLGDVTSMDSIGLSVLFEAFSRLGERLVIIVSPTCAHTIHIAQVRDQLPIIEG